MMILRIENIDLGRSITVIADEKPQVGQLFSIGNYVFIVETVTEFTSHILAIVRTVSVTEILPSQLLEVDNADLL